MKTYELSNGTGWIELPSTIKKVVVHFKNGDTDEMDLLNFVVLKPKVKKQIAKIDCYNEDEL